MQRLEVDRNIVILTSKQTSHSWAKNVKDERIFPMQNR